MPDNLIQMQHSTKGSASFSHNGEYFDSDESGIIAVPSHFVGHAKAHGFSTDVVAKEKRPLAKLAKGGAESEQESEVIEDVEAEKAKPPVKGAKLAKGGAE
jgi:hypothetical protein